jgi:hypothetical protein
MAECTFESMKQTVETFFSDNGTYRATIAYHKNIGYMYLPPSIPVEQENGTKRGLGVFSYYAGTDVTIKAHAFIYATNSRSNEEKFDTIDQFRTYLRARFPETGGILAPKKMTYYDIKVALDRFFISYPAYVDAVKYEQRLGRIRMTLQVDSSDADKAHAMKNTATAEMQVYAYSDGGNGLTRQNANINIYSEYHRLITCRYFTSRGEFESILQEIFRPETPSVRGLRSRLYALNTIQRFEYTLSSLLTQ